MDRPGDRKRVRTALILISRSRGDRTTFLMNQYRRNLVTLRTMAQMSLEQSINCNFITPGLAQAAVVRCSVVFVPHCPHCTVFSLGPCLL